jgi:hypothetical protein
MRSHHFGPIPACRKAGVRCNSLAVGTNPEGPDRTRCHRNLRLRTKSEQVTEAAGQLDFGNHAIPHLEESPIPNNAAPFESKQRVSTYGWPHSSEAGEVAAMGCCRVSLYHSLTLVGQFSMSVIAVNNNQSITERESSARSESSGGPYVIAMLYAASRSGKQSQGFRSSLSTAGFTLMWNDARSRASFGPSTLVNLSTVVLKSLACICCNSIVIVMSNNPLSHS